MEQHTTGEDGETIGWRYRVDAHRSVWCGEISRRAFEEQLSLDQREAAGDSDGGWFIVLFNEQHPRGEQMEVLARVLDENSGRRVAQLIAAGLMPAHLRVVQ